jgi:tetratricopeptide (TPR) repeat protein
MNEEREQLYNQNDYLEVIRKYEEMLSGGTRYYFDVHEFEEIIDFYLDSEDFQNAYDAAHYAIELHPSSFSIQLKVASALVNRNAPRKALKIIKRVEACESHNPEVFILKGTAYVKLQRFNEAKHEFENAIALSYEDRDEVLYTIAVAFCQCNEYLQAIDYLREAEKINPKNVSITYELAFCYDKVDLLDLSEKYYRAYLQSEPLNDCAWYNLGLVYSKLDNFDKSIEAYNYALSINPKYTPALFNKANMLANYGKFEEAIEIYKEYTFVEEHNAQAYCYIGECYEKLNEADYATFYYKKALDIDANMADAWYGLSIASYMKENVEQSLKHLLKAIEIDEHNVEYLYSLGNIYAKQNESTKAIEVYRKIVRLAPDDFEAWVLLSETYARVAYYNDAVNVLLEGYSNVGSQALVNYRLASYFFNRRDYNTGADYLRRGLESDPSSYTEVFSFYQDTRYKRDIMKIVDSYKH